MKVVAFALVFVFLCCGVISAAESQQDKKISSPPQKEVQQDKEGSKLVLDNIKIEGRIEKPQTVFILPSRDTVVDDVLIDRSFFKEIFRKIEKDQLVDASVRSARPGGR